MTPCFHWREGYRQFHAFPQILLLWSTTRHLIYLHWNSVTEQFIRCGIKKLHLIFSFLKSWVYSLHRALRERCSSVLSYFHVSSHFPQTGSAREAHLNEIILGFPSWASQKIGMQVKEVFWETVSSKSIWNQQFILTSHVPSHAGEKCGGGLSSNCEEAKPSGILAWSCLWSLINIFVVISLVIAFLKICTGSLVNTG